MGKSYLNVDIASGVLKHVIIGLLGLNPLLNSVITGLLDHRRASLKENSLLSFKSSWLKKVFKRDPCSTISRLHLNCASCLRGTFSRSTFASSCSHGHVLLRRHLHEADPASLITVDLLLEFNDFESLLLGYYVAGVCPILQLPYLLLHILVLLGLSLQPA
jgi:hypothetical protein